MCPLLWNLGYATNPTQIFTSLTLIKNENSLKVVKTFEFSNIRYEATGVVGLLIFRVFQCNTITNFVNTITILQLTAVDGRFRVKIIVGNIVTSCYARQQFSPMTNLFWVDRLYYHLNTKKYVIDIESALLSNVRSRIHITIHRQSRQWKTEDNEKLLSASAWSEIVRLSMTIRRTPD